MTSIDCQRVITLSEHATAGKREKTANAPILSGSARGMEKARFFDTLFDLLGEKRQPVIAFIEMKLDSRRRRFFRESIRNCRSLREECGCVKDYIRHLPVKDLRVLLAWIRRLLAGTVGPIAYQGEPDPERRLAKFARSFDLSEADVDGFMLYFLLA